METIPKFPLANPPNPWHHANRMAPINCILTRPPVRGGNRGHSSGGGWQLAPERRYVYDGMRVVQERDAGNWPQANTVWGSDLSGTFEGAGGIGGLLVRQDVAGQDYLHSDGGGNVTTMINSSQAVTGWYRYDPFGTLTASGGTRAAANPYRFSTKEFHTPSGLYYYGYRFYDPYAQRWINKDPLGTSADFGSALMPFEYYNGGHLYHYVYNSPINSIDPLGLDVWIVRDNCSKFGHEWVVGENGDGTYWDSNKMPGKGPLAPANCPADIQFNPTSGFDPKNLNDPCLEIKRHVVTSPAVDKRTRDEAEKRAKEDKGRYDALGSNCRDYSNDICNFAVGGKLRELLEKQKAK